MEIVNDALPIGVKILVYFLIGEGVTLSVLIVWFLIQNFLDNYKKRQYEKGFLAGLDEYRKSMLEEAEVIFGSREEKE